MTSYYESYIGTSQQERNAMLSELGYNKIMDLFREIPSELIQKNELTIPGPMSEAELLKLFTAIAAKNKNNLSSFLGGGTRQQYIPAMVEEVMQRGELYTAYTPYQPEISQGMLQLIYEYQSMVAELFAMDVVNASMYDWGSAIGEALLIMTRITRRSKLLVAEPVSPQRLEVAKSYLLYSNLELEVIPALDGNIDMEKLIQRFASETSKDKQERNIAGLYIEVPTYFGTIPDYPSDLADAVHEAGSLLTVGVDPSSLGVLSPPGEYGADLVVGEGQLLGNAINSGGPLLGILATKNDRKWIRQLPGRLIGKTKEQGTDRPGYCITLQTREQHIRRDKATSNICTNQSITAVNTAIYLAALGKQGIVELSQSLHDRSHYLATMLSQIPGITAPLYEPFFCEFVVEFKDYTHEELEKRCIEKGVIPGKAIIGDGCKRLIAVSELHCKVELNQFIGVMEEVMR
ncbi:MAG: aminomethyl-transferring glycine dehydrogenase subunit GcvPA [Candidatus Kariarchaeaceae archaeon]|jgi:glycine dehydrogenase subunit 1